MAKIKDIPKVDRPRERLLKKGSDAISKTDLLAILLGSGIKGVNVQSLAKTIITKFNQDFLNISVIAKNGHSSFYQSLKHYKELFYSDNFYHKCLK